MKKTAMSDAGMIYLDFITSSLRVCLVRQSYGYIARAINKGKFFFPVDHPAPFPGPSGLIAGSTTGFHLMRQKSTCQVLIYPFPAFHGNNFY
jgi:hypothetical protein